MIVIILAVLWVIVGGTVIYIFLDIDLYETHSCDLDIMSTSDIEEFNSTFTAFQGEIKVDFLGTTFSSWFSISSISLSTSKVSFNLSKLL